MSAMSTGSVTDIGNPVELNIATLSHIAKKCHVSLDWLINGGDIEASAPTTASNEKRGNTPTKDTVFKEKPEDEFMTLTPRDVFKSLVVFSRICSIRIVQEHLSDASLTIELKPKSVIGNAHFPLLPLEKPPEEFEEILFDISNNTSKHDTPIELSDMLGESTIIFLCWLIHVQMMCENNLQLFSLESLDKLIQCKITEMSEDDSFSGPITSSIDTYSFSCPESVLHVAALDVRGKLEADGEGHFYAFPFKGRYCLKAYLPSLAAETITEEKGQKEQK